MASSTLLTVTDLAKSFGPDEIFRDVSFQVADREHVALVGVNGAGKSTVLRIVAGIEAPTRGEIATARGSRLIYLAQESRFDSDRTVREEARLAFQTALDAAARMREIEHLMQAADSEQLDELFAEYERLGLHFETAGGYDVEHRTEEVLAGLGFTEAQFDQPVHILSGGQKTRVALAKALLGDPDILLLDEPTNHLDLSMVEWLEGFLRAWTGAFLVVSHDRYFLDRVTNRTLDLSFGRLEDYPAPYAKYLTLREERKARRRQEYAEQQEYIARTEEFIRRYKAGQRSREARGRQTRLDRLERIERPQDHAMLNLRAQASIRSGRDVIHASKLQAGYRDDSGPHPLVTATEIRVERGDRVAIVGPNGSGKSTLLKTIVGELLPLAGRVEIGTNVKMGYYAQAHEGLPDSGTPLTTILAAQPLGDESARTYLARFLFSGDDVYRPISGLSGGERSRLALACLLLQGANLLVLDEPTNHLDIQSRETLEEMLAAYDGTVVFVSHDRFFIDRIATKVWEVEDGSLRQYLGNYTDAMRQKSRPAAQEEPKQVLRHTAPEPKSVIRRSPVESESRLQKKMATVEREIGRLEGRLNDLSDAIAIAGIDNNPERLAALGEDYTSVQTDLDAAYEHWHELTDQLAGMALTVPS